MKRKDLIKKLEKKEKELKVAIDMGEKIGEEIRKLYSWNGEDKLINN